MNLFALTGVPGARIIRFPLTQDLQVEVQAVFAEQLQSFLDGIVTTIPFDGRYIPDEGELLAINNFDDLDGLIEATSSPVSVDQFDPQVHSLGQIKALFTAHTLNDTNQILIQYFESRRLIANKGLTILYSNNTFRKMTDAGLALDNKLLAIMENRTLKFKSFYFLRRVFELGEYFNEATNEEVAAFATHAKLSVQNVPEFLTSASPLIRKKIFLIQQSNVLNNFTTAQIVGTAETFNLTVETTEDGRIVLPENKTELRCLLRFLDEDYYASSLTKTHFVSNSKRVAE